MHIMNINGVSIISQTGVAFIRDGVVVFNDGSTINLHKRVRSNFGAAKAAVVTPNIPFEDEPLEQVTEEKVIPEERKPKRFAKKFLGQRLSIEANEQMVLSVVPHDGAETVVTVTGPAEDIDAISFEQVETEIRITAPSLKKAKHNLSQVNNVGFTTVFLGSMMATQTTGIDDSELIKAEVKVPKGQSLSLTGVWYQAVVGDIVAPLHLSVTGHQLVSVGKVGATVLEVSGQGDVVIDKVTGALTINHSGAGRVLVNEVADSTLKLHHRGAGNLVILAGSCNSAVLDCSGTGNVQIGAVLLGLKLKMASTGNLKLDKVVAAEPVSVSNEGVGNLKIAEVTAPQLTLAVSGLGDAKVEGGKVRSLNIRLVGLGNIAFGGSAVDATLQNSGAGNIKVSQVTGTLTKSNWGQGNIKVISQS